MKVKPSSTHSSLCFMLKFAQCFGMLPVSGITGKDYKSLSFSWTSKRTLYSILFLFLTTLNVIFQFLKMIKMPRVEFGQTVTLLFFFVTALTVAIFLDMARKWPNMMQKWAEVEKALASSYQFPPALHEKLKKVAIVVMTAAIVEHSLFLWFAATHCQRGETLSESIQLYFEHGFDQIFNVLPYSIYIGVVIQLINTFSTVSWNFMDLFIIVISLSLSARFKQVVRRISFLTKRKENNEILWRHVREDYTQLVNLCTTIDDSISNIILVSFGNNIFIMLVQLYFSLQRPPSNGVVDKVYYVYSFTFLIIRTISVALYAATINVESKKPLYYLSVSTHNVFNVEIERFLYMMTYITVSLTGRKLFKVTKSLILNVAGAIVSYELVLIQFNVGKM